MDTSNVLKPKEEEPEKVRPVRSSGTGGGDGFGGDAELRALFEPVSYTHLDVYKRQW